MKQDAQNYLTNQYPFDKAFGLVEPVGRITENYGAASNGQYYYDGRPYPAMPQWYQPGYYFPPPFMPDPRYSQMMKDPMNKNTA